MGPQVLSPPGAPLHRDRGWRDFKFLVTVKLFLQQFLCFLPMLVPPHQDPTGPFHLLVQMEKTSMERSSSTVS